MKLGPILLSLGLFGVLGGMQPAVAAAPLTGKPCDARRSNGTAEQEVAKAEIPKLEAAQKPHHPKWKTATRLAELTIVASGEPSAKQCASWKRVLAERSRVLSDLENAKKGKLKKEWQDNRWIKDYALAKDLRAKQLFLRVFVDQFHIQTNLEPIEKKAASYLFDYDNEQIIRDNANWLKKVLGKIGWFDIRQYGPEASQAAWLLVQHSDYDVAWQSSMLATLKPKVATGDMQPTYYAYLADRVATNRKLPQTYGTQGKCSASGAWEPFPLNDPAALDARRAEIGLEPMSAYKARFQCRKSL